MRDCDVAVVGGTVIPMVRDRESFTGDVLISRGRIVEISHGSAQNYTTGRTIHADNCLVLPGLIQGHVHVVQSLLRHQADGLDLLEWLRTKIWPYEASLDADGVTAAAELGIAELLCGGTTTVLDFGTTRHHHRVFEAAARAGIRMISGKTHMDGGEGVPPLMVEDPQISIDEAAALGERWHGACDGRLSYAVTPRFVLSCSRGLLEDCVALARRGGWLLHTHASESPGEVAMVRRLFGRSNIDYLDELGLTGPDVVLAHGVHLDDEERALLADTGTGICHCPGANLKLASGIADLPALLEAGIRVGLGADGPPCNNRLSVFQEMALAGTLHNLRHGAKAVDAWTVLALATREGARLLRLDDEIGTLEPGKKADLTILDGDDWPLLPAGDPASRVVYGGSNHSVLHVLVDGRVVVEEGKITTLDASEVRENARTAWSATRSRMEA